MKKDDVVFLDAIPIESHFIIFIALGIYVYK